MYLPTVTVTIPELERHQLPYLRKGQWLDVESPGSPPERARWVGYSKHGTIYVAWRKACTGHQWAAYCSYHALSA